MTPQTGIGCVIVPDGVEGDLLHLSLCLSPQAPGTIDIATWPEKVAALCSTLQLEVRDDQGTTLRRVGVTLQMISGAEGNTLWQRIFSEPDQNVWNKAFDPKANVPVKKAAAPRNDYDSVALAAWLDSHYAQETAHAVARQRGEDRPRLDLAYWAGLRSQFLSDIEPCDDDRLKDVAPHLRQFRDSWAGKLAASRIDMQNCDTPPDPIAESANLLQSRLVNVQAYPSLARFLNLIIDIAVPAKNFFGGVPPASATGQALVFGSNFHSPPTAFEYDKAAHYFGPRPYDPKLFKLGVLDLSATIDKDAAGKPIAPTPRFVLSDLDITGGIANQLQRAENRHDNSLTAKEAKLTKLGSEKIITVLPEQRSRGVALLNRAPIARPDPEEKKVLYAENLIAGYRVDVFLAKKGDGDWQESSRWRSLTSRNITYREKGLSDFWKNLPQRLQHCDDGRLATLPDHTDEANPTEPQEMFVWSGENLSLQSSTDPKLGDYDFDDGHGSSNRALAAGGDSLPVNMLFGFRPGYRAAPLREGRGYMFGARACLINGGGLSFEQALARYATAHPPIVGAGGKPFTYTRRCRIKAPDILIPTDEPLFALPDSQVPNQIPGDVVDRLVVRDSGARDRTTRMLVPPRIPFENAEQAGLFDHIDKERPPGMFAGAQWVERDKSTGHFPLAANGKSRLDLEQSIKENNASRGMVWHNLPPPPGEDPVDPYYPDPKALSLFVWLDAENPDKPQLCAYPGSQVMAAGVPDITKIAPIPLILKKNPVKADAQLVIDPRGAVTVSLSPGRSAVLKMASGASLDDVNKHYWITLASDEHHYEGVLETVQNVRSVTLVHAVEKPVEPNPGMKLFPVRIAETKSGDAAWPDYVASQGQGTDPSNWRDQEKAAKAYFTGTIAPLDRPSTGKVRCEAQWEEHSRTIYSLNGKKWKRTVPKVHDTLFSVDHIDYDGATFDLLHEDDSQGGKSALRSLAYTFKDGAARKLKPRLIQTSRYTDMFLAKKGLKPTNGAGQFENSKDQDEVWVNCTFRPPMPEPDKLIPLFQFHENYLERKFDRQVKTRIYLKRPWDITGEGEKIALLLLPRGSGNKNELSPFVTRWGADLLHRHDPSDITDEIVAAPAPEVDPRNAAVWLGRSGQEFSTDCLREKLILPNGQPFDVNFRVATPSFCEDTGLHYCDLTLDSGAYYFPFVQLALARFQEHGLENQRLSLPAMVWTQLMPKRNLTVGFPKDRREAVVTLAGVGYTNMRKDMPQPEISVRLMVPADDRAGVLPGRPGGSQGVRWTPCSVRDNKPTYTKNKNGDTWQFNVHLQENHTVQRYGLLVEERELIEDEFGLHRRAPTFSYIVDLGHAD